MATDKTDNSTAEVLERIERAERRYQLAFLAAVILEAVMLILYLALADFSNRIHVLLLVATVATVLDRWRRPGRARRACQPQHTPHSSSGPAVGGLALLGVTLKVDGSRFLAPSAAARGAEGRRDVLRPTPAAAYLRRAAGDEWGSREGDPGATRPLAPGDLAALHARGAERQEAAIARLGGNRPATAESEKVQSS